MNIVSIKAENFATSCAACSFSRATPSHGVCCLLSIQSFVLYYLFSAFSILQAMTTRRTCRCCLYYSLVYDAANQGFHVKFQVLFSRSQLYYFSTRAPGCFSIGAAWMTSHWLCLLCNVQTYFCLLRRLNVVCLGAALTELPCLVDHYSLSLFDSIVSVNFGMKLPLL